MRPLLFAAFALFATGARGQVSPKGMKALDDAMALANLRPGDLGGVAPPAGASATLVAALHDPMAGLTQASVRHRGVGGDEVALLRTALSLVGKPEVATTGDDVAELPETVPEPLRRPVGRLVEAVARANDEIRASLVRLSAADRRTLIEALPRLAVDDPTLPLDFARTPPDLRAGRRLLELVDAARIEAAGIALAATVRATLPELRAVKVDTASLLFRTRGVLVEIGGRERNVHDRRDVGLCIDLGGDDRYAGRYGAGIGYAGVLIDLGGDDRYLGPDGNYGAGLLGVGLAWDLAGNDVYGVRSVGLGAGLAGVGLLVDADGDDRYRIMGVGLGAGVRGIGIVTDRLGDDGYEAGRAGEGFGALAGVGWSVDLSGDDAYRGGTWVQATGNALGYGLLTDAAGNDGYRAVSGQGTALGGYASLGDGAGEDVYTATGRAQGFASEGGFAALIDESGADSYLLKRGPGQASAFAGVAVLTDLTGDDVYAGTDGTPASAQDGGIAILMDGDGDDRYLAASSFRPGDDGIALWADGGGRDRYGDGRQDSQATVTREGAALDAFGASDSIDVPPPALAPGTLPMPSPSDFEALRRRAEDGPDSAGALVRLVGIGAPALEALAREPDATFVAVAVRLGALAAPTVGRLAASKEARQVRASLTTAGFVPLPPEAVLAALDRPELAVPASDAAGRIRLVAAVPLLVRLTASADPLTVRHAAQALAAIGDPTAVGTASALVDHPDLAVRRAAFRLLAKSPEVAFPTGVRLLGTSDVFRRRIGLALLGVVGTPTAIAAIAPSLSGDRDAKIGALLALDGKVPVELVSTVEALRRDADPLVRAVAQRTNAGT